MARRPNKWMMKGHILATDLKGTSAPNKTPTLRGAKVKAACGELVEVDIKKLRYGRSDCVPCKTFG